MVSESVAKKLERVGRVAYVNALAPLAPALGAPVRFYLLATARSGSSLLRSMLDSHPDIRCDPEMLAKWGRLVPPARLYAARSVHARFRYKAHAYGSKAIADQVAAIPPDHGATFLARMNQRGYRIITVTRRDTLARAISRLEARRSRVWQHREGDHLHSGPILVRMEEIEAELNFAEHSLEFVEASVKELPHLRVVYEDDLDTPDAQQATFDRLCNELGLRRAKATTDIVRSGARSMRDRIANYDEMMEFVRGSRFAAYADPARRHSQP
jgi:LPS sulfotransferase NodH